MPEAVKRVFSGIQPTGPLGMGHYLGAIRSWLDLQHSHHCLFGVMDLHAITLPQDPALLRQHSLDLLAWYLACGLDPERHVLFCQSHVPEHTQLAWVLTCLASMGELSRMTQFKDKSCHDQPIGCGLFAYPTLMAADILLYRTDVVPVGDDQKQHLELARDLAARFNMRFGDVLGVPEPYIPTHGGRVMSLQDPGVKMSKSDPNQNACLLLGDEPSRITKKIKRAVTDSQGSVDFDPENRPGISNLLRLYAAVTGDAVEALVSRYHGQGYGAFKSDLAEAVVALVEPIQARYHAFRADEAALARVLNRGREQAQAQAQETLQAVYHAVGFYPSGR